MNIWFSVLAVIGSGLWGAALGTVLSLGARAKDDSVKIVIYIVGGIAFWIAGAIVLVAS